MLGTDVTLELQRFQGERLIDCHVLWWHQVCRLGAEHFGEPVDLMDENSLPSGFDVGERSPRNCQQLGNLVLGKVLLPSPRADVTPNFAVYRLDSHKTYTMSHTHTVNHEH